MAFVLTAGQAGDTPASPDVMAALRVPRPRGRPRTRPDVVLADKAYSSRAIREHLRRRGIRSQRRSLPMAGFRNEAIARGALPVWTVKESSAKTTSRTWWLEFSTAQCPRTYLPRSPGLAWWVSRLVSA
ncbi:transposase [Streptomyces sp. PRB2-1]|uniref:Transposase n=1 Tax=Actinacidiphila epipremni TaxID=2053013 RepID=A0ABX0ZZ14_9ACTN|nr:transposase [Actinacidiphila epipremni]